MSTPCCLGGKTAPVDDIMCVGCFTVYVCVNTRVFTNDSASADWWPANEVGAFVSQSAGQGLKGTAQSSSARALTQSSWAIFSLCDVNGWNYDHSVLNVFKPRLCGKRRLSYGLGCAGAAGGEMPWSAAYLLCNDMNLRIQFPWIYKWYSQALLNSSQTALLMQTLTCSDHLIHKLRQDTTEFGIGIL